MIRYKTLKFSNRFKESPNSLRYKADLKIIFNINNDVSVIKNPEVQNSENVIAAKENIVVIIPR